MFGTLTSRYHFASSYLMMPFVPVLTDADAKRAQLVAELSAKKQAREEEDAAALKALEEHKEKGSNRPRSETIARVCLTFLSPNLRENKNKIEVNAQYSSSR